MQARNERQRARRGRWRAMVLAVGFAAVGCGKDDANADTNADTNGDDWEAIFDSLWDDGSDEDAGAGDYYGADAGTFADLYDADVEAPEPFSKVFEDLVPNTALWGAYQVEVLAVRTERGMDEPQSDWSLGPSGDDVYLEVDLGITNRGSEDDGIEYRRTWDILLADGSRIRQSNELSFLLAPGDRTLVTLRHILEDGEVDLHGAALQLNGSTRGSLHAENIPLDAPYAPDVDLALPLLTAHTFETERPEAYWQSEVAVEAARLSRNSPTYGRAAPGTLLLELQVAATLRRPWIEEGSEVSLDDGDFGLVIMGELSYPDDFFYVTVANGSVARAPVLFVVPDDVDDFRLRVRTSNDGDLTPVSEWQELDLRLIDGVPFGD